jgi:putative ABC transport system permease protein
LSRRPLDSELARRRAGVPHASMFVRMLLRAAVLRRGRAMSALLGIVVAAAVTTAMLNLYVDVEVKLRKEFRNYGANLMIAAKDGQSLPPAAMQTIASILGNRGVAVPFAYVVARTQDGQSVVVSGTDFDLVRKLDNWWSVTGWPQEPQQALVGTRALAVVSPQGNRFDLTFRGRSIHLAPAGTLATGAAEDSRVYMPLPGFESWTSVAPSTIEIAAYGSPKEVALMIPRLAQALPSAEIHPLRQVMAGEGEVLAKTRATLLWASALIILTSASCVLSTLIGWVFDRRRDFAIMKALGASERLIGSFLAAEAAGLGMVGAVLGFVIGIGLAAWIGRANFHASVAPRLSVFPAVLLGSVAVALISAVVPISLLRRVQPAMILRGE